MSKELEQFDIFDARMNPIGTAPRPEVHKQGYWHQTFQCWIVMMAERSAIAGQMAVDPGNNAAAEQEEPEPGNSAAAGQMELEPSYSANTGQAVTEPELLFQMRHPGKDTFPSLLDISCAGHLLAGERVEDGVRELAEELGVEIAFERLRPCGVFQEEQRISPVLIDREFCHVFVLPYDQPLEQYKLQEDEVTGLYRIPLSDVRELAQGRLGTITADGVEPDERQRLVPVQRQFTQGDFVPHSAAYYDLVLNTIEQIMS